MRPNRLFLILLALCASASLVWADARSDARTHYQAGQKAYAAADYKVAIKEFSAAQDLAPADLNNYNLALCYDKIGDADNALTYYKQYLDKVPDAPKRAEIEASMARLDGAKKSSQAKKADEQKKLDDQKKADADAAAKKQAELDAQAKPAEVAPPPPPPTVDPNAVGSTGTPSTGLTVSTGDAQLDRVQGINIDQIRDQRVGGGGSGIPDNRMGPNGQPPQPNGAQPNANGPYGGPQPNGMAAMNNNSNAGPNGAPLPNQPAPEATKETPVYKKWWFWVVVAVSAYVVYEIATQDSSTDYNARMFGKSNGNNANAASPGGMTLLRF